MKKGLFLLSLLVLCISACSKDATVIGGADGPTEINITEHEEIDDEHKVDKDKTDESQIDEDNNANEVQDVNNPLESYFLDIPQYVQETGYYCAVACLQSVMGYHGLYATQEELAKDLNTDLITGTEYEDLARVATSRIFPNGNGVYSYCIPSSNEDRKLFEQRVHQDMSTKDPIFISINNKVMYGDVSNQVHEVVLVGVTFENGTIVEAKYFDPSYTRQDSIYGGLKICTGTELWDAMINNPEPGYVY